MAHTLMFDEFDEFNNQNLSISIDIQLLSNRRCNKPRNPVLSVIDSILFKAWIFSYFFPEKFILIERPLIIADEIDSDVTTSGGKTRLAIKTLELIEPMISILPIV